MEAVIYQRGPFTLIECPPDNGSGAFPRDFELVYKCGTIDEEIIDTWDNGWEEAKELSDFIKWIKEKVNND